MECIDFDGYEQNGKRINPFQYIAEMRNEDCSRAVALLVPKMQMHDPAIQRSMH